MALEKSSTPLDAPWRGRKSIPIIDPKWVSYIGLHGEGLGKTSSGKNRANTRKWESRFPPTP
jgi:hypothetical protein